MGILSMNSAEHDYWVNLIAESSLLLGQPCKLYQILKSDKDLQQDPEIQYKDPIDISIMFEDNPKPILKKLNWFSEDEDLPYVAYITTRDSDYNDIVVQQYCIVEIPITQYEVGTNKFIISKVRGNMVDSLVWICQLVPYREPLDMNPDTPEVEQDLGSNSETSYNYIKR